MRALLFSLCIALGAALSGQASAADSGPGLLELEVIDPYVDLHSGPGRGYPVFYVLEQGEVVDILSRRPGWYEVRTASGKLGWAEAAQISRTLQSTGEPADLPSVSYGDYLKSQWQIGFNAGWFSSGELEASDIFTVTAGYRPLSWLALEAEAGKFFGSDMKGDFYNVNVVMEPLSHWRISPLALIGRGVMSIDSQPKLVPLDIGESYFNNYGLGFNYYVGRNFVFRAERRWFSVSTDKSNESVAAWKFGFSTFF